MIDLHERIAKLRTVPVDEETFGTHDSGTDELEPWATPTPLTEVSRTPFPIEALAGFDPFDPFLRALAEFTQTPVDLPAAVALGTVSAAVGGKFEVTGQARRRCWHGCVIAIRASARSRRTSTF